MDRILKEHRKSILTAVVFVLLAVLMWLRQSADSHTEILTREKPGGSVRQEQIYLSDRGWCDAGTGIGNTSAGIFRTGNGGICETGSITLGTGVIWERMNSEKARYEALKLPEYNDGWNGNGFL